MDVGEGIDGRADNTSPQAILPYAIFLERQPMTLEEIKKAADLAREVEKLEREHQNASKSCFNPQILFASRSSCFQHSSKFIPITKYEVLEIIEKRLANLKAELFNMGVKT